MDQEQKKIVRQFMIGAFITLAVVIAAIVYVNVYEVGIKVKKINSSAKP